MYVNYSFHFKTECAKVKTGKRMREHEENERKRGSVFMTDVLFYQNYTPVADVCTIAISTIHWFLLGSTYAIKKKNLSLFRVVNFLVMFAAISNITYHEFVKVLSYENIGWVYVTRNMTYLSLFFAYALYCVYVWNLVGVQGRKRTCFKCAVWGGFAIFGLIEVTTAFTKMGFYIDGSLQIHQNYYLDVFRLDYIYNTVLIVALLVLYRRKFVSKIFHCMMGVLGVLIFIMVLQAFLLSTSYVCIAFTFPIIAALFLFHYNGYDVETGTLDGKSFGAYISELGNKPFQMISLRVQDMTESKRKELLEQIFELNEQVFHASCVFRMRSEKALIVFQTEKNKKIEQKMEQLLSSIESLYDRYHMEYKIILMQSGQGLVTGNDYLSMAEFAEARMSANSVYRCEKQDVDAFSKASYILKELQDIHVKQDMSDARVLVYCQPVLNTKTNTFTSAEALMRLDLPECGLVFPDLFIPLAERHGYIHTLSRIILNKTCKQVKRLEEEGYQLERVSVNFSIIELKDKDFCEDITRIIRENDLPYGKIAIELTESRSEKDFENVKNVMQNLQGLGVKFYLDDFGTGYSNFERIIGLPIDIIKFDRSLTILAGKNAESRFLVGSFSDIFKKSNYQILFEGVENERDENQCKEMNALYLQGYKYSKPIPMEHLTEFLKKVV